MKIAVDDFGTGYSSLNYIRRFPVDILKVDKSFVDGVAEGGEESALTAAIIELAGILNLRPVAEGIERADQLEKLLELNCELGQGYYFSEPLTFEGAQELLREPSDPGQQGRRTHELTPDSSEARATELRLARASRRVRISSVRSLPEPTWLGKSGDPLLGRRDAGASREAAATSPTQDVSLSGNVAGTTEGTFGELSEGSARSGRHLCSCRETVYELRRGERRPGSVLLELRDAAR